MTTGTIQMPEKIQLDESTYSPTFGRFIVQPLEKGFGVTIGNAMRRVLLSSLPGFAITAFKVDGVQHEFSTIPGVVEDVPDMVLNMKQVRMKLINKKTNRVVVPLKGPMDFTAGEIQKASPDVEILNPKLHIATLNNEANFELDLRIGRGIGYVVAEENKAPDQTLGVIPIDSVFTPIVNVRYFVETTRVGQQTDYEKLTIEIDTDGSITPDDALAYAGKDHARPHPALHQFRHGARGSQGGIGTGRGIRARPEGSSHAGGRAGAFGPLAQLPARRQHQNNRRPRAPGRVGASQVPQFRAEIARRTCGDHRGGEAHVRHGRDEVPERRGVIPPHARERHSLLISDTNHATPQVRPKTQTHGKPSPRHARRAFHGAAAT